MSKMETMETGKTKHISRRLRRFARANKAVSALEYAILVGVIAVGIAAALATFSHQALSIGSAVGGTTIEATQVVARHHREIRASTHAGCG